MKPLSWDTQLGLASPLEYAAIEGGKAKGPSRRETGLDASHLIQGLPRGDAENFFLDILSHRITYHKLSPHGSTASLVSKSIDLAHTGAKRTAHFAAHLRAC